MTKLSVNVNKFATLRNSRGGNMPDVLQAVKDCEQFGANGITVHPRPDERHIRYRDVRDIRPIITTEFNIEGNPIPSFIDLVLETKPDQVTLVPDAHDAITSNAGWNTLRFGRELKEWVALFKKAGIRTSIFVDPDPEMVSAAAKTGTDRVELYTEAYAKMYSLNPEKAIEPYIKAAQTAMSCSLGLNAGHDLNLENIAYFRRNIPGLLEVSIGHALICESIYLGLENTIQMYLRHLSDF
ncbi:MAG: Pyridoxine 5'-phosphate synthase [Bacteroidetes bacterium ADurb.Bin037]|nr:MAG: Pyridoxine 5'-phosphate synthase [Bacteroidetes bacterium ADurb.Bin037]HPW78938.1 pyridoxine 5'-phosphate synthase [Bacteroidales bacterium]HQB56517.1 pyridoxine 5'-phosphate synthase [Bacteroidales bacterium]